MTTFRVKPWDKATQYENTLPVKEGDIVTLRFLDHTTQKPFKTSSDNIPYQVSMKHGVLGIANFGEPLAWFYKDFSPFDSFSQDVEFTVVTPS